ncbi:subtilisin-like protease 4 [Elaeis guineensis]|uniref:Subtilisin-like protease SBT1.2 n=1 Tax=Elaeis guineensis var. tenera TaxID=51953 RepID=A0A6I9SHF2_ELAGV|nr:subtilisin-like protease SBT1.2 [Elaeis guineensis]
MAKPNQIPFFLLAILFMFDPSILFSHGQLLPIVDEPRDSTTSKVPIYIVHVVKPDGTDLLSAEEQENWYKSFLPSTHLETGEPRLVYSYTHVMSGFAARLTPEEVRAMEDMDGFVHAYPDQQFELFTTYTPSLLGLNGWQSLWGNSSYGEGVIVGVIDSGIHPTHPSFQDNGMPAPPLKWRGRCYFRQGICNNKLIGAMGFNGGANPLPLDDIGHGTHVASTVAGSLVANANVLGQASGNAVGIAPRAHIAVYKVLFNNVGSQSDILAGINQAIADGVDVLQMSLGLVSLQLHAAGVNLGSFAAIQRGIVPCAAAGNSGPQESVIANDAPWVLTVGASTTDRRIRATVKLGDGTELNGESAYQPSGLLNQMRIVHPGASGIQDYRECRTLNGLNVRGMIVLCWGKAIGGNVAMGQVVKAAGGAAMIVVNDQLQALTTTAETHVLPAVHVDSRSTQRILNYIGSTPTPTATIEFKGTLFGVHRNPAVATFSSRGPSLVNHGIIKPDIVAPGVSILAAWPNANTFNFLSGTSMATPHVSGIVSLLKKIHPQWTPAAIKSAIMTTAYTLDFDGNFITDQYPDTNPASTYYAMGAGHINPSAAADPGLVYDIDESEYIAYLCGTGFSDAQVTMIAQRRINCFTHFQLTAEQLNYPSISLTLGSGGTKIISRTVTNVGEANSVYSVQINEPSGAAVDVSPNQLFFSNVGEKQSYRIRFRARNPSPARGQFRQGQLSWVSNNHAVRSPILVTFA